MDSRVSSPTEPTHRPSMELNVWRNKNNKKSMDFEGNLYIAVNKEEAAKFAQDLEKYTKCVPEPDKLKVALTPEGHLKGVGYTQTGIEFAVEVWKSEDPKSEHTSNQLDGSSHGREDQNRQAKSPANDACLSSAIKAKVEVTGKVNETASVLTAAAAIEARFACLAADIEMKVSLGDDNKKPGKTFVSWNVIIDPKGWLLKAGRAVKELTYSVTDVENRAGTFFTSMEKQIKESEQSKEILDANET